MSKKYTQEEIEGVIDLIYDNYKLMELSSENLLMRGRGYALLLSFEFMTPRQKEVFLNNIDKIINSRLQWIFNSFSYANTLQILFNQYSSHISPYSYFMYFKFLAYRIKQKERGFKSTTESNHIKNFLKSINETQRHEFANLLKDEYGEKKIKQILLEQNLKGGK